MPPEEHAALVAELFKSAADVEPRDRAAFLDRHCGANRELRSELESLLRTQERAGQFLERSAADVAARNFPREGGFAVGQVVREYEIISLIGQGGMGEVYLARDRRLQRNVALKLVRRGMDTEDIVRRFQHEQRLLAGLNHPNIAQLYDAGLTEEGIPFFVMEYIDGRRIDEYCQAKALTLSERLELFTKVCGAVHHAHQHLVVHRDIKPSNILVTVEGEPKLLDFGIAKLLDAATDLPAEQTITVQNVMTPEYASPEHVRGEPITTASDVYSLGVLLYELLTGSKPYEIASRTPVEIARVVTEQEPRRPSTAIATGDGNPNAQNPNPKFLRGDLDNIVLMAMRKEPQRRYPSAAQLSADIRRHLDGLPVSARKDTLRYRSSKFIRRNRLAVAAAALVLVSIIAGLVVALWQAEQAGAQRDLAQREKSKAERINQFLQTMLSFSNTSVTSLAPVAYKKDATVIEMLDRIGPRIHQELADQPEVHAQVLRTLGSAYASQGRFEDAEKNFRAALAIQDERGGKNGPEAAATMLELGVLLFRQMRLAEASSILEKAKEFYEGRRGAADYSALKLALASQFLGSVRAVQGDMEGCFRLYAEAVAICTAANFSRSEQAVAAIIKGDYGAALVTFGQVAKGAALLREAIIEFRQLSNEEPWELAALLTSLGTAEFAQNHPEAAEKYLAESEQLLRRTVGERNVYFVGVLERQANVLIVKNQLEQAEKKAREALALAETTPPDNRLVVATCLQTLGAVLTTQGKLGEGEEYYRRSLGLFEELPWRNHYLTVFSKFYLSQSLMRQNRFEEAERVAVDAREEARRELGEQSATAKTATNHLIAIYEKQGKHDQAAALKAP